MRDIYSQGKYSVSHARPEALTSAESGMIRRPNRVVRMASTKTENLTEPLPLDVTVYVVGS
jgi:hypothetical protein